MSPNTPRPNYARDLELLRTDFEEQEKKLDKLEDMILDLKNAQTELEKVIAVRDELIKSQGKDTIDLESTLTKLQAFYDENIKTIHNRINKLTDDLLLRVEESKNSIVGELGSLRRNIAEYNKETAKKISDIDIWRYTVMGAIAIIAFLAARFISPDGMHALFRDIFGTK